MDEPRVSFEQKKKEEPMNLNAPREYPLELVMELCGYISVNEAKAAMVQEALNILGKDWWELSNRRHRMTPVTERNEQLGQMATAIKAASEAVERLAPDVWECFDTASCLTDLPFAIVADEDVWDLPSESHEDQLEHKKRTYVDFLSAVGEAAEIAVDYEPTRRGRQRDHARQSWLEHIRLFLTNSLNQPFTRNASVSKGEITPAERFCVAAFQHLSPETSSATIKNEMKKLIRDRNKRSA